MPKNDAVLVGFHSVLARLKRNPQSIHAVYVDPERRDQRMRNALQELEKNGIRVMKADHKRLEGMSRNIPHQGIIALAAPVQIGISFDTLMDNMGENPLLLLLDGVTDPRNFGACLRVADAAGVRAVIVPKDRSATLSEAAIKASAGACESVDIVKVTNLAGTIVELKDAGIVVVGAAGEAEKSIYDFVQTGPFAWVLGAEGDGLRQLTRKRCSELAHIPMKGSVESLNVSVATGICLYETLRQRILG